MDENWKEVEEDPRYMVSDMGNVKGVSGRILKPSINNKGYLSISFSKEKAIRYAKVHRIVAMAFIPNPENKPYVDHISGCKTDNRVSNLRWATQSENQLNPNTPRKPGGTGYRYIIEDRNRFVFTIERYATFYKKRFKTIEEALAARDEYFAAN